MDFMRSWRQVKPEVVKDTTIKKKASAEKIKEPNISQKVPMLQVPENQVKPSVTPPGSPRLGSFISSPTMRRKKMEGMADLDKMMEQSSTTSNGLLNVSSFSFKNFNKGSDK